MPKSGMKIKLPAEKPSVPKDFQKKTQDFASPAQDSTAEDAAKMLTFKHLLSRRES